MARRDRPCSSSSFGALFDCVVSGVGMSEPFFEFVDRLNLFIHKNRALIKTTLSNIFSMRLIGNKTHGDLAEIAIAEFINQFMYDYKSTHVGKDLYRAKSKEEDITVKNEISGDIFPVSLKAYGHGPLQLSTDKSCTLFPLLEEYGRSISDPDLIAEILEHTAFADYLAINVLPLIYDERRNQCNILVFMNEQAMSAVNSIVLEDGEGTRRTHPVYRFYDEEGGYVFEVRYGGRTANALQRGLWTHTQRGAKYFRSVTDGWVTYEHNKTLITLIARALVASEVGHREALPVLDADIGRMKLGITK
jgi:hypothetical protein